MGKKQMKLGVRLGYHSVQLYISHNGIPSLSVFIIYHFLYFYD